MKTIFYRYLFLLLVLVGCQFQPTLSIDEVIQEQHGERLFFSRGGEPFSGTLIDSDQTQLYRELSVKNGYLEGNSIHYFPNSSVSAKKRYKAGRLDGESVVYRAENVLHEVTQYTQGTKNGTQKIYYPSGELNKTLTFSNGLLSGVNQIYFRNGSLKQEFFLDAQGERDSVWRTFYESGQLKEKIVYKGGEKVSEEYFSQ